MSMARVSPTASSRRISGVRALVGGAVRRTGRRTIARPVWPDVPLRLDVNSGVVAFLVPFEELNRTGRHYGRDCMLIDELGVPIATKQDGEIVEPRDDALQLYAIHQ